MLSVRAARAAKLRRPTTRRRARADVITQATSRKANDATLAMVSACSAAAAGFELCAERTHDETIAVAAKSAAAFLRALRDSTIETANAEGVDVRPRARTCDRLRWEWLASTATVLDGSPDGRLARECARILSDVDVTVATGRIAEGAVARFRVALAEARSLAAAIDRLRTGQLAIALG